MLPPLSPPPLTLASPQCACRHAEQAGSAGAASGAAPSSGGGASLHNAAPASAGKAVGEEAAAGTSETGLGVAGMLRRIGLWASERPERGEIRVPAREVARWIRAEARCAAPRRACTLRTLCRVQCLPRCSDRASSARPTQQR